MIKFITFAPIIALILLSTSLFLYWRINNYNPATLNLIIPAVLTLFALVSFFLSANQTNTEFKSKINVGLFTFNNGTTLVNLYKDFANEVRFADSKKGEGFQFPSFYLNSYNDNYWVQYNAVRNRFIHHKWSLDEKGNPLEWSIKNQVLIDFFISNYIEWLSRKFSLSWDITEETNALFFSSSGSTYPNHSLDKKGNSKLITRVNFTNIFPKYYFTKHQTLGMALPIDSKVTFNLQKNILKITNPYFSLRISFFINSGGVTQKNLNNFTKFLYLNYFNNTESQAYGNNLSILVDGEISSFIKDSKLHKNLERWINKIIEDTHNAYSWIIIRERILKLYNETHR